MAMTKKQLSGIVALSVFFSALAGGYILDDKVYFCSSTSKVCINGELSDGGIKCKALSGKITKISSCAKGWELYDPGKIEDNSDNDLDLEVERANGKRWTCKVKDKVWNYTNCNSETSSGYLGELVTIEP